MSSITLNIPLNATRIAQVVAGGAALVAGYQIAATTVRSAYVDDLLGPPTEQIDNDGTTMIYQNRKPQGGTLTNAMIGAGFISAFAGGVLALGAGAGTGGGISHLLKSGGGVALFTLGIGAIAGATALSKRYEGSDFVPVR
jgi:hypothetical protein